MSANFEGLGDKDIDGSNITLIDPTIPGGTTTLLLGGSMTAKSTLIVQAINNLIRIAPDRFNVILLMTESINAEPLADLPPQVIRLPCYVPEIIQLMVKVNQATHNRYGFLVIMDDCTSLRDKTAIKAITIWRNSGVSTIISIQDPVFVSPAMRQSFHNVFITGARTSEARKKIGEMFVYRYLQDRGIEDRRKQDTWMGTNTALKGDHRLLIRINGVRDEMFVHKINRPN